MARVNAYTIAPDDLKPGDEMLFTVKALVKRPGYFSIYRCAWDPNEKNPQGTRVILQREIAESIFPVLINAGLEPE